MCQGNLLPFLCSLISEELAHKPRWRRHVGEREQKVEMSAVDNILCCLSDQRLSDRDLLGRIFRGAACIPYIDKRAASAPDASRGRCVFERERTDCSTIWQHRSRPLNFEEEALCLYKRSHTAFRCCILTWKLWAVKL